MSAGWVCMHVHHATSTCQVSTTHSDFIDITTQSAGRLAITAQQGHATLHCTPPLAVTTTYVDAAHGQKCGSPKLLGGQQGLPAATRITPSYMRGWMVHISSAQGFMCIVA